jgi:outer membrane protein OmpA-like peptidoglycan-associated protein/tetratricopeptide (TPR) repeat protein
MRRSKRTDLKNNIFLTALIFLLSFTLFAQEECEVDLSSKAQKLLEKGSSKKVPKQERIAFLNEALEIDDNCLACYYNLGIEYFKRAKTTGSSYSSSEENFKELIQRCPSYHSDPYYYLGVICYGRNQYEKALEYFNEFVNFPLGDESKFSSDYDKKYDDVQEVIKDLEFKASFYGNPVPFNPVKVNYISTNNDEYLPTLSPDNELIFFTRKSQKKAKGDLFTREVEELTWGKRMNVDEPFDKGVAMEAPFNLGDNYGGISLSINNKEMFVTVCKPRMDGYNNCDIYLSRFERYFDQEMESFDWGWSELEELGPNINTPDGWEAQPTVSGDGKTLYFATAREASIDHSIDIYKSHRNEDGTWSKAVSIGDKINTSGNEKSPFIHSDSKTLYFASDARKGAGGYDIYYVRLEEDSTWSKPENIGFPINSDKDEHGLIVSTDGNTAYYASNQIQGHGGYDIYRFELPKEAKPESIVLLKGQVDMEEAGHVEDVKISVKNVQTEKVTDVKLDEGDGKFAVVLNVEESDYIVEIEKEDAPFEAHVFTKKDTIAAIAKVEYKPVTVEVGSEYVINDIHYATNSADFDEDSEIMLTAFADYLDRNPKMKVVIQGHTDNVGDDLANYALSADRAFTVKLFLEGQGISPSRIDFKGLGEKEPIASNETEAGRALNRRTTFKVLSK